MAKQKFVACVFMIFCIVLMTNASALAVSQGGTLTYAQSGEPRILDPLPHVTSHDETVIKMLYNNLVRFKPESKEAEMLEIEPDLATSWEQSPDGLTWTFHLRKGVTFHDDTPFTADAVVYFFKRAISEPKTNKGWPLFQAFVKTAEAVDPYTVKVLMKKPCAFFLNRLAHGGGGTASVAAQQKFNNDLSANPVGTGPFKLSEWVRGDHITLVAHEKYWRGKPLLDKIIIKPVMESSTRVLQLEAGQIDVASNIPDEAIPRVKKNNKLEVITKISARAVGIQINSLKKPFDSVLVRQALNYAVDKKTIVKHLYEGYAVQIPGDISPMMIGYEDLHPYDYNPERAKELLAKAGYPNGFSTTLWQSSSGVFLKEVALGEVIQKYLAEVGVKAKIQLMEYATMNSESRLPPDKSKHDMVLMGSFPSTGEATWELDSHFTKAAFPPTSVNRCYYYNPVFEELLEKSMSSTNEQMRNAYLRASQCILSEDAPMLFLLAPMEIWGQSRKVHDMIYSSLVVCFPSEKTWVEK